MKVLILQMARLGDIFQTWPTLHALQRQGAEVHVLVRPRFAAAIEGCEAVTKIHRFETDTILGPILEDSDTGLRPSLDALDELLTRLDSEKFDRIVNLSFSPLSSWVTFDLEMRSFQRGKAMAVAGYTRHVDGAFAIPDDASAFFFAQVGYRVQTGATEAFNRLSLPRLFATIAGVDPVESDWRGPKASNDSRIAGDYVAIHVGASSEDKTLDADAWGEVAARMVRRSGRTVVLLGSAEERTKAEGILDAVERQGLSINRAETYTSRVISLVGETQVSELFDLVSHADLLIGGDSALVQIASLTGTRVLNLSSRTVSHWETGPLSAGSRILVYGGAAPASEIIAREAVQMLEPANSEEKSNADRVVAGPLEDFPLKTTDGHADFVWGLISSIYLRTPFPAATDARLQEVLTQWAEIQNIENFQLNALLEGRGDAGEIANILERVDELTRLLAGAEPRLAPIERWWSTEKLRCGPQSQAELVEKYLNLNAQLETVLQNLREVEGIRDGQQLDI